MFWKKFSISLLFFLEFLIFFENYLSENLIIRNWFMSVGIRLKVFVIQLSLDSGISFYRSIFLVSDLDEYYHLKVLNVYFRKETSDLKAFELVQKIIISQLPLINFRWFPFLKNSFATLYKILFPQTRFFWKKNRNWFKKIIFEYFLPLLTFTINWFMSVGIRFTGFWSTKSLKSDMRFYRCQFLVRDLDEYYYLKVLNVYFC